MVDLVPIEDVIKPKVKRSEDGRPWIEDSCGECAASGRVPSEARPGKTVQCKRCRGAGKAGAYYSRTTTYIDVLEDKSNIAKWQMRSVALGLLREPGLMEKIRELRDPMGADRAACDVLCKLAQEANGSGVKALAGSHIHQISEQLDAGEDCGFIPPDLMPDLQAYIEATRDLEVIDIETFAVLDQFRVAGTFDRGVLVHGAIAERLGVPDGEFVVADIKTGRIDLGLGKICLQLTAYSRMLRYDLRTMERSPILHEGKRLNQDVGLIIHLPLGVGECSLVPVDLHKGWEGLELVGHVRHWRSYWNRKANQPDPILRVRSGEGVQVAPLAST